MRALYCLLQGQDENSDWRQRGDVERVSQGRREGRVDTSELDRTWCCYFKLHFYSKTEVMHGDVIQPLRIVQPSDWTNHSGLQELSLPSHDRLRQVGKGDRLMNWLLPPITTLRGQLFRQARCLFPGGSGRRASRAQGVQCCDSATGLVVSAVKTSSCDLVLWMHMRRSKVVAATLSVQKFGLCKKWRMLKAWERQVTCSEEWQVMASDGKSYRTPMLWSKERFLLSWVLTERSDVSWWVAWMFYGVEVETNIAFSKVVISLRLFCRIRMALDFVRISAVCWGILFSTKKWTRDQVGWFQGIAIQEEHHWQHKASCQKNHHPSYSCCHFCHKHLQSFSAAVFSGHVFGYSWRAARRPTARSTKQ